MGRRHIGMVNASDVANSRSGMISTRASVLIVTRMSLECEVFPALGCIHVTDIKAPEVWPRRAALVLARRKRLGESGQRMSSVFVYAIS